MKKYVTWVCRCGARCSVRLEDWDLKILADRIKCWAGSCRFYMKKDNRVKPGQVMAASDVYRCISGRGSEEQRQCGPSDLHKLMLGKKVVAISVEAAPEKTRSLISSITFEGGHTVHLAPSTKGVTAYKVTHG